MNFTPLDYMVPEIWCAKNGWADEQMGRQTDGENDIKRWVPHLKNKQFRNIQEITEKKKIYLKMVKNVNQFFQEHLLSKTT